MSDVTNHCELRGLISIFKSYPAKDGKKAFVIATIKSGDASFDLRAWEDAAHDLGNAGDLTAKVTGRLGKEKPLGWDKLSAEEKKKVRWATVVVVEKVDVATPKALKDESIPF